MKSLAIFAVGLLLAGSGRAEIGLDPTNSNDVEITEEASGIYSIVTTGHDPWVVTTPLPAGTDVVAEPVLSFEYFCAAGVTDLTVYFGPPWREAASLSGGAMARAETWQPFAVDLSKNELAAEGFRQLRLDTGGQPGVKLQVRGLHLRAPTAEERQGAEARLAALEAKRDAARRMRGYLDAKLPGEIEGVQVDADTVEITGKAPPDSWLAEIELHEQPWALEEFSRVKELAGGEFRIELPRKAGATDRIFSRWAVVRRVGDGFRLASHAKAATDVTGALRREPPTPMTPASKKGMAGVDLDDDLPELLELGVHNISVNFVLSALLLRPDARGGIDYEYEGERFRINERALARQDRIVEWATSHGVVVTGVVLVRLPVDPELAELLAYPGGGAPGLYVMPNLATPDGSRAYRALLEFVVERYSRADREFGSVERWVMHNEIDQAWVWTNMGEQPMELVMDVYVRSMRAMHNTLRQYDPTARTFISLTHFWTDPAEPDFRQYRPREMLDLLAQIGEAEGDFEWGVAYHPYPESLFEPATWNDTAATFDFDTKMITPKNIEVLPAYLAQPRFLFRGQTPRTILLTEQGYHTKDDSPETQDIQAAAFVYTWHKIRPLPTIESFLNHRWKDHPGEGGLRLGIRGFPAPPEKPMGDKKRSWEVYRALDTPDEMDETDFAKDIIGTNRFEEIPHDGKIE